MYKFQSKTEPSGLSCQKMKKKAIIIGSGVAGLALSIRLAKAGYQVEVLEANPYAGGKLSVISVISVISVD